MAMSARWPARSAARVRMCRARRTASRRQVAVAPRGDRGDLATRQRLTRVDAEVDRADQRGEGVDRAGPLAGHLLTGADEYSHRHPSVFSGQLPWCAQTGEGQPEDRPSDPDGIELVALTGAASVTGRHLGSLEDRETGGLPALGHDRAVGARALDDHQRALIADPTTCALGTGQPCSSGTLRDPALHPSRQQPERRCEWWRGCPHR